MINSKKIARQKMISLFPPNVKRMNMTINGHKFVVVRRGKRKVEVMETEPTTTLSYVKGD